MFKVLPQVMRNSNELNIPYGCMHGFEILYFGVNLKLMCDYRLTFNIKVMSPNLSDQIEVLIVSRKDVPAWKDGCKSGNNNKRNGQNITVHYVNSGKKINDVFRPSLSDAYAFILSNRPSGANHNKFNTKVVTVILTHSWLQKIKESHLKDRT